ncbi:MAG: hypothetical protein RLZZ253_2816 [Verrucomicrobiota bacterium]
MYMAPDPDGKFPNATSPGPLSHVCDGSGHASLALVTPSKTNPGAILRAALPLPPPPFYDDSRLHRFAIFRTQTCRSLQIHPETVAFLKQ